MSDKAIDSLILFAASLFLWLISVPLTMGSLPLTFDLPFKVQCLFLSLLGLSGLLAAVFTNEKKHWGFVAIISTLEGLCCLGMAVYLMLTSELYLPLLFFSFTLIVVGGLPPVLILESRKMFTQKIIPQLENQQY